MLFFILIWRDAPYSFNCKKFLYAIYSFLVSSFFGIIRLTIQLVSLLEICLCFFILQHSAILQNYLYAFRLCYLINHFVALSSSTFSIFFISFYPIQQYIQKYRSETQTVFNNGILLYKFYFFTIGKVYNTNFSSGFATYYRAFFFILFCHV